MPRPKSLAVEYASRGIRANAGVLGGISTPTNDPSPHEVLATLNPMGRLGDVDDAVDAVLYLDQAGFLTGEILHVDGGESAGHGPDPAGGPGPVEERHRRARSGVGGRGVHRRCDLSGAAPVQRRAARGVR